MIGIGLLSAAARKDEPVYISTEADIASSITWDGTPPSSLVAAKYRWGRVGGLVTVQFRLEYGVAGTTNTSLTIAAPSDLPLPWFPSGTGASEAIDAGSASVHATAAGLSNSASRCYLRRGASSGFDMVVLSGSIAAMLATGTFNYFSDA